MAADFKWWPWVLAGAGVVAVVNLGKFIYGRASSSSSSSPWSDAELGTVAAVPGLRELEAKEPGFIRGFLVAMKRTGADADKIAALISEETGFTPKFGLMGWIDGSGGWAKLATGHTSDELHAMSGLEQLPMIEKTIKFAPGYLKDPPLQGWGHGMGEPDSYVLATKGDPKTGVAYDQNARAYDQAGKGVITAGDVRAKVYATLTAAKGQRLDASGKVVS